MNNNIVDRIIQLRKQGIEYKNIAKELNVSFNTVRYHCEKHGLSRKFAGSPLDRFIENLNKNHGHKFEYVSRYVDSEKPVLISCKKCKHEFERAAQFARKTANVNCPNCFDNNRKTPKKPKSRKVIKEFVTKKCFYCKQHFQTTNDFKKYCSNKCSYEASKEKTKARAAEQRLLNRVFVQQKCKECGGLFKTSNSRRKYCSEKCSKRNGNRRKRLKELKIKTNGFVDSSITLNKLITKEKNVCYLCGGQCDSNDFTLDNRGSFIVGPNYPSIEHVIPVSKGGTHTWDNVKLAHHYCNSIKNDKKIIEETGQLVLLI